MCGRYFIDPVLAGEALKEAVESLEKRAGAPVKTGEICPGDEAAVFARAKSGKATLFRMKWGWKNAKNRLVINARSETAETSAMFSESMAARRCLIPASWYFEWEKREDGKVKQEIAPAGGQAFYLAGLYRMENDQPVFVVLTRDAAPGIAHIHDRMPVMLKGDAARSWLGSLDEARSALNEAQTELAFQPAEAEKEGGA